MRGSGEGNEICIKSILEEEEEERRQESEARSREDRELAVKIQEELKERSKITYIFGSSFLYPTLLYSH